MQRELTMIQFTENTQKQENIYFWIKMVVHFNCHTPEPRVTLQHSYLKGNWLLKFFYSIRQIRFSSRRRDFKLDIKLGTGLIPILPLRINFLLYCRDFIESLSLCNKPISIIDFGCGPCAIFSVLGKTLLDAEIHWPCKT